MALFVVQRLLLALLTLWGVSLFIFLLMQLLPGDAAISLLGTRATDPVAIERMRAYLGLDLPIHLRYFNWLAHLLRGDFGVSVQLSTPIAPVLALKTGNSLILAGASLLIVLVVGVPAGIALALRRGSLLDRFSMFLSLVLANLPVFWLGLVLMYLFSLELGLFPTGGMYSTRGDRTFPSLLHHLILPAFVTSLISLTVVMRIVRATMIDSLGALHVRALSARGIHRRHRVYRHALASVLPVTANVMGLQVGWLFSGALFTEVIFSWPGIGQQIYMAVLARDVAMVLAAVLATAVVFVAFNLIADVIAVALDPGRSAEL